MVQDSGDGVADGFLRVMEAFQPGIQVDVGTFQGRGRDAAMEHFLLEVAEAHVAGTAGGVGNDHDFRDAQFIDGDDEASHGGIPGGGNDGTGILDDLGVAVFQAQGILEQDGQARVHTTEDGEFLVGEFVGQVLLISLGSHIFTVEREDSVNVAHSVINR